VAQAAIDAHHWKAAREAMKPVLDENATQRACLIMADIEEGEYGDKGRMREWLSRAVRAPRDPAWTADGVVSETWKPASPVTGEIDAFEWKVPVERIDFVASGPAGDIAALSEPLDESEIEEVAAPLPIQSEDTLKAATDSRTAMAAGKAIAEPVEMNSAQLEQATAATDNEDSAEQAADEGTGSDLNATVQENSGDEGKPFHLPDDPGVDPEESGNEKRRFGLF
jgi:HemY protein